MNLGGVSQGLTGADSPAAFFFVVHDGHDDTVVGPDGELHEPFSSRDVGLRQTNRERGVNNLGYLRNASMPHEQRRLTKQGARQYVSINQSLRTRTSW